MRTLILALIVAASPLVVTKSTALASCPSGGDVPALIERLKAGGFILVFRHADRYSRDGSPRQPAHLGRDLPNGCTQTTQALTPSGVAQAEAIGAALKDVPVDDVFATTRCRTIETAQFAFGRSRLLEPELEAAIRSAPADGMNTVIVSHSESIVPVLSALDPEDRRIPACGEAAVIDPDGADGGPICVAKVLPRDWDPANASDALGWENEDCKPR